MKVVQLVWPKPQQLQFIRQLVARKQLQQQQLQQSEIDTKILREKVWSSPRFLWRG